VDTLRRDTGANDAGELAAMMAELDVWRLHLRSRLRTSLVKSIYWTYICEIRNMNLVLVKYASIKVQHLEQHHLFTGEQSKYPYLIPDQEER